LQRNPKLAGKVDVRFVIERDGRVSQPSLNGNTLPDCDVTKCIVEAYRKFAFPKPDGGIVTVVYPIHLASD
jgi:hypothetical protein